MEILTQLGVDNTFWVQLALFLVSYLFLSQLFFKPYLKNLAYRKKNTSEAVEEAQKLMSVTDNLAMEYEGKIKKQNEEALHLYSKLKQQSQVEEQKLLATARAQAEKILKETQGKITQEMENTRKELEKVVPEISEKAASKLLGRQI